MTSAAFSLAKAVRAWLVRCVDNPSSQLQSVPNSAQVGLPSPSGVDGKRTRFCVGAKDHPNSRHARSERASEQIESVQSQRPAYLFLRYPQPPVPNSAWRKCCAQPRKAMPKSQSVPISAPASSLSQSCPLQLSQCRAYLFQRWAQSVPISALSCASSSEAYLFLRGLQGVPISALAWDLLLGRTCFCAVWRAYPFQREQLIGLSCGHVVMTGQLRLQSVPVSARLTAPWCPSTAYPFQRQQRRASKPVRTCFSEPTSQRPRKGVPISALDRIDPFRDECTHFSVSAGRPAWAILSCHGAGEDLSVPISARNRAGPGKAGVPVSASDGGVPISAQMQSVPVSAFAWRTRFCAPLLESEWGHAYPFQRWPGLLPNSHRGRHHGEKRTHFCVAIVRCCRLATGFKAGHQTKCNMRNGLFATICVIMSTRRKSLASGFKLVIPVSAKAKALAEMGVCVRSLNPPAARYEPSTKRKASLGPRRGKHPLRTLRQEDLS